MDFSAINSVQDLLKANESVNSEVSNVMQVVNQIDELNLSMSEMNELMMGVLAYIKKQHMIMLQQKAEMNDTEQVMLWSRDLTLLGAAEAALSQVRY